MCARVYNKRKSGVLEHILVTEINTCHRIDEYECVQNEISYEITNYIVYCCCATSVLLNFLVNDDSVWLTCYCIFCMCFHR